MYGVDFLCFLGYYRLSTLKSKNLRNGDIGHEISRRA